MIREVGVADCGTDLQPAVWSWLDLVEWQTVNIEDARGSLDVEFHQVHQRGPAANESHVPALLRGSGVGGHRDGCSGVRWSRKFKGFHAGVPGSGMFTNFLDCGDDILVRAATTDVAAH